MNRSLKFVLRVVVVIFGFQPVVSMATCNSGEYRFYVADEFVSPMKLNSFSTSGTISFQNHAFPPQILFPNEQKAVIIDNIDSTCSKVTLYYKVSYSGSIYTCEFDFQVTDSGGDDTQSYSATATPLNYEIGCAVGRQQYGPDSYPVFEMEPKDGS